MSSFDTLERESELPSTAAPAAPVDGSCRCLIEPGLEDILLVCLPPLPSLHPRPRKQISVVCAR